MADRSYYNGNNGRVGNSGGGDDFGWPDANTTARVRRPGKKFATVRSKYSRQDVLQRPNNMCYELRQPDSNENGDVVQWETMTKHFARLPTFLNDQVDNFKNGYTQTPITKIPENHHLQYYSDLHKLHQVAYATRNTRKPSCCKQWKWSPFSGELGSYDNAYYLSDPRRYAAHAKKIIIEDSRVIIDEEDKLSLSVWKKYMENRQSESVFSMKMAMWSRLSSLIKTRAIKCGLYLVGSTMNGFGGDVSDADFCLLTDCTALSPSPPDDHSGLGVNDGRACGIERLQWLMSVLQQERVKGYFNVTEMCIVYAKVPILRFNWNDNGRVDVDLCCNNVVGIRNTHLLYCYSKMDIRVRPLVLTIKLWASRHNINDPKNMTLSSYSLVLMVINFLQCIHPPVLPSLQRIYKNKFCVDADISYVHMHEQLPNGWTSENKQSLGELLLKFFEYYNEFNYYKYAVSVRTGRPLPLEHCRMAETTKNDPGQWKFIGIEEPFERTNTARSVYNHELFTYIKHVISKSYERLNNTGSLNSIFNDIENITNKQYV
ncbi:poly(A) RNA polymerase gld-2 homolog A-like isoform X2 [Adelges cooleyi]|uniref:poly(A) RNA polymerase gld-2 homolog A-like isoform X2 n=1 Tax=Adelges cooleyi TaxID=133065 RepID=UPI00217F8A97|nr:poly(A) RNA polymerase gld-2 homolog A-like isoform X2 [Adelges cooleyi]